jgi:hypothetical protein
MYIYSSSTKEAGEKGKWERKGSGREREMRSRKGGREQWPGGLGEHTI